MSVGTGIHRWNSPRHVGNVLLSWESITADAIDFLLHLRQPLGVVAHGEEEGVERSTNGGNGNETAASDGVCGLVVVELLGLGALVVLGQPQSAPARLDVAGLHFFLDIVECFVESCISG